MPESPVAEFKVVFSDGGRKEAGIRDICNCTVRALAIAANINYSLADSISSSAGRKRGRGFNSITTIEHARKHGVSSRKLRFKNMTVQKFLRRYPSGRYYVAVTGHAFAVIDGVIYDSVTPRPLQRVRAAYFVL
jgi:hypothetical protein